MLSELGRNVYKRIPSPVLSHSGSLASGFEAPSAELMLLSFVSLALPFVCMFTVVLWVASNKVYKKYQKHVKASLFCQLT